MGTIALERAEKIAETKERAPLTIIELTKESLI